MIILMLPFLFLCSFVLFIVSRHDFVLLRQSISIRQIFDKAFLILILAFIVARIFYFINERSYDVLVDPLRFTHIVLFYGFNFFGFLCALAIGAIVLFRKRKNVLRILDIYLLSFSPMLIFVAIENFFNSKLNMQTNLVYAVLTIIAFIVFIKMHNGFKIKDGIVAFSILIYAALSYLALSFFVQSVISLYSFIQIFALIVLAVGAYSLILIQLNFFKEK